MSEEGFDGVARRSIKQREQLEGYLRDAKKESAESTGSGSGTRVSEKTEEDKNLFFEHCLKLKNFGSGELVPFKLNEVQLILHHMCERMLEEEEHVRIIVLKARRFGISSYVQGRFFHNVVMNFNKLCQIATHSKGATDSMFAMTKIFEENYPEQIKPSKRYSGKRELVFGAETGGLNSEYSLCTVGGKEVRGSQIDFLHCSEVASWGEHGDDYFLGLLNCVIAGYGTEVIVESTASGVGGLFYDLWVDAVEGFRVQGCVLSVVYLFLLSEGV